MFKRQIICKWDIFHGNFLGCHGLLRAGLEIRARSSEKRLQPDVETPGSQTIPEAVR
jgi:hypothetical protein